MWLVCHNLYCKSGDQFLLLISTSFLLLLWYSEQVVVSARPEPEAQFQHNHHHHHNHNSRDQESHDQIEKQRSSIIQRVPSIARDIDYFENLDLQSLLQNKKFIELQIKCIIYGKEDFCDYFGRRAKELLPTIILDNCKFCTPQQKIKLSQVVVHLQQKYPAVWRDSLIKFGQAPKFITAGHANPSIVLFGKKSNYNPEKYQNYNPVLPMPLAADGDGEEMAVKSPLESDQMVQSIIMMPTTLSASAAPELVRSVESPTPPTDPTTSPDGGYFSITSSAEPPSTSVVESTIEVKPTTIEPEDEKTE